MKKLNKLQINKENLMKNEELVTLRGGYDHNVDCRASTKIAACEGSEMYEGHGCCWTPSGGYTYYGKCVSIYGQPLHCSDLN